MGQVVEMAEFKRARGTQVAPSEDELVAHWVSYVKRSWRPVRGVKRGAVKAVMRVAYRESDHGREWTKPCPIDLVAAALPREWSQGNLKWATYLSMLLWDYLWRIGEISEADKEFCFTWTYKARDHMQGLLDRYGVVTEEG